MPSLADLIAMADMLGVARHYVSAGLSVIPVRADGSKAPKFSGWRDFTTRQPTDAELVSWFGHRLPVGIGVVPGPASNNLVILDFECKGGMPAFSEWMTGLDSKLAAYLPVCPVVRTPSGGRHVWVKLAEAVPGGKLARYAKGGTKVEVRGEGHQVLAPGCPPECHSSGNTYEFESWGWLG